MDYQAAGEIVAVDEGQQRILKQARLERTARIAGFRNPADRPEGCCVRIPAIVPVQLFPTNRCALSL
jgi:hypothetical protein